MAFEVLPNLVSLLVGTGLAAAYFRNRDQDLAELKAKVERHCESDRSQEFAAKLEIVIAQNDQILADFKRLNRDSAAQARTVASTEKGLAELWEKFDDCRQSHPGGKR